MYSCEYACDEHGGEGWEAVIVKDTRRRRDPKKAQVHFSYATDDKGRPYPDEYLPLSDLRPL